jgi:hypothetical protein
MIHREFTVTSLIQKRRTGHISNIAILGIRVYYNCINQSDEQHMIKNRVIRVLYSQVI